MRRHAPRTVLKTRKVTTIEATNSTTVRTSASSGLAMARVISRATRPSSPVLTTTLLTGSGEVFTSTRTEALALWDDKASRPPAAARAKVPRSASAPLSSTAPAAGRMPVWIASHTESTAGILSTTSSTASRATATAMAHGSWSHDGESTQSSRPAIPRKAATA